MTLLKDKKVIITGGNSGIGKAIAKLFVSNGADVIIYGTNKEKAEKAVVEIKEECLEKTQHVSYEIVDVSNTKAVEKKINDSYVKLNGLDILVNNAGITKDSLLIKMTEDQWDDVMAVNLKSVFNTCRVAVKLMMKKRKGSIINVASVVGIMGNSSQCNYSASKAGVIGFTKSLAKEIARRDICVNAIAPGYIETPMTENLPEEVKKAIIDTIPLKRMGTPHDVARVALFLASQAEYMTGQVISIDGGMVM